jgi:hypothetical protein
LAAQNLSPGVRAAAQCADLIWIKTGTAPFELAKRSKDVLDSWNPFADADHRGFTAVWKQVPMPTVTPNLAQASR